MYDLSDDGSNIWLDLRKGALGAVLLGLRGDRGVATSVLASVQATGDAKAMCEALSYAVWASANCIGQLAYYQFMGAQSSTVFLEPKDPRWSLLRVLPENCLQTICESMVANEQFIESAAKTLSHLVQRINVDQIKSVMDANEDPLVVEFQRQLLKCLGAALGHALTDESKSLRRAIGELVNPTLP